jgi:hypothetical protein
MPRSENKVPVEGMDGMLKIVSSTISRRESAIFQEPVDWKALGLHDYRDIIQNPMDLGTIKKNIEGNKYQSIEECAQDIRLVWSNCMLYNRDGSEYYHLADKFAKAFEDAYSAVIRLQSAEGSEDNKRIPTVEQRIGLSYDIFKIDNIAMARVLTIVEEKCPSALQRKIDEVLVNFDALYPETFHEINKFVLEQLVGNAGLNKKRKITASAPANATKKK